MAKLGRKKKLSLWGQLKLTIRSRLLSGLLVIVPLGITVFVVRFIYELTVGRITPLTETMFSRVPWYALPLSSIILFFALLYVVGMVATAVVGRRIILLAEAIIDKIPLVATVYGATKQIVETLSFQEGGTNMKSAVLVHFPYKGMKSIGFLTGRLRARDGTDYYKVFIPTAPNISVGLFQLCAAEDVFHCSLSVEDAVKMIVSGGIISPERLRIAPVTEGTAALSTDSSSEDD